MKKLFFAFLLMLIASIGNINLAQAQWAEYELPAVVTSVTVAETGIHVFTSDRWFQVTFPLPASGQPINWAENIIPGTGAVKSSVITREGLVFILRDNGDLWRYDNGQWEHIFPDQVIEGLSEFKSDRFFAWSRYYIYEYFGCGFTQMPFNESKAIAFNDEHVMVFTEIGNYSGPNYWSLLPGENLNNFYPVEATMTDNEYVVAGSVVGDLAAWHQSPPDACVPFTHVLTAGVINSATATKDTFWVVGRLGEKGMLFNTTDMSGIYVVPETVWQVRSNNLGVVAAVSDHWLYVRGEAAMVGLKSPPLAQSDLQIVPNPIENGNLRIISPSNREARIFDLSGQQIATLILNQGENQVNMAFLPSGIYLLEGKKFIIP